MMDWAERKQGFIFDVDGTLYSQSQMHIFMLFKLLSCYALRPWRYKELYAVWLFRKCRENEEYRAFSIERMCQVVAERIGLDAMKVKAVIHHWLFVVPLNVIKHCAYSKVTAFANEAVSVGKTIIIYSDYPALEKLSALAFPFHFLFVSGESGFPALKPCEEAMRTIIQKTGLSPQSLLYIGDRDQKDRRSAELVGIAYLDIRDFLKML